MPTVGIKKRLFEQFMERNYSKEEVEELCFDYGLELDDVVTEKNDRNEDEIVYKIELPANRYDLLCVEGLTRALRIFQKSLTTPRYSVNRPGTLQRFIVKEETQLVRPILVAAVLRNVTLNKDSYASFIDLQDKLHHNICRRRTLVSMGTHDLDTVKGPFEYRAERPQDIRFQPLNQDRIMTGEEIMEYYSKDLNLREYVPIIRDKEYYPVIYDSNGVVLSLPPLINGDHSKITLNTKNILIEVTATDLKKAKIVLDTLVTMFSQYCGDRYTVEPAEVVEVDSTVNTYPELKYLEMVVHVSSIVTKIGIPLNRDQIMDLLTKMSLQCEPLDDPNEIKVVIPPTRHDILHECDIAEDIALAYGYNKIELKFPESNTVAQPLPINKLTDQLRINLAAAGWTEVLNFALCSTEDVTSKMRKPNQAERLVKIANPKTIEFQVARNALIPGLLKTLSCNKDMPLPLKIFEVQDVIFKDEDTDTNARNERHLAALHYSKAGCFEVIHGLLDRIMELLETPFTKDGHGYYIKAHDDPSFFDGRCAQVVGPNNIILGTFGILHPEVMTNYGLTMPCSAVEINIEPFL